MQFAREMGDLWYPRATPGPFFQMHAEGWHPDLIHDRLPLGLQLTAAHGQDARVIQTAVRLQRVLGRGSAV